MSTQSIQDVGDQEVNQTVCMWFIEARRQLHRKDFKQEAVE